MVKAQKQEECRINTTRANEAACDALGGSMRDKYLKWSLLADTKPVSKMEVHDEKKGNLPAKASSYVSNKKAKHIVLRDCTEALVDDKNISRLLSIHSQRNHL